MHLCRTIFEFQDRHPGIHVDSVLTDERSDLIRDGIGLGPQIGPQPGWHGWHGRLRLRACARSKQLGPHPVPLDVETHQAVLSENLASFHVARRALALPYRHVVAHC